jgi:apolipoprotein N-acyltransferase
MSASAEPATAQSLARAPEQRAPLCRSSESGFDVIVKKGMGVPPYHSPNRAAEAARATKKREKNTAKYGRVGVAAAVLELALAFGTVAVVAQDKEAEINTRRDTMKRQGKDLQGRP